MEAMDTSIVIDSQDFSEEEWTWQKKKLRRDNARKIINSNGSSSEGEDCTERPCFKASKNICQQEKKSKGKISNKTNNLLPSLPKSPPTLSSQLHNNSNTSRIYVTPGTYNKQNNVQIGKLLYFVTLIIYDIITLHCMT